MASDRRRIKDLGDYRSTSPHAQEAFEGLDIVHPHSGLKTVADVRGMAITQSTCLLTAAIMTPLEPANIRLTVAVLPGGDDGLIVGWKTLREQLHFDVMQGQKKRALSQM